MQRKTTVLNWIPMITMVIAAVIMAFLISRMGFLIPGLIIGMTILIWFGVKTGQDLRFGFYLLIAAGFFITGCSRYIDLPLGLAIDFLLVFLFFSLFLKRFRDLSWKPLRNPVFIFVVFWFLLNCMQILNPEARSLEAWFFAMRGVALYFILALLIGYLFLSYKSDFNWFIHLWFLFSLLGTLWGIRQRYFGLDSFEMAWLQVPGNMSTHLLFGKLRIFSFYSDAGQFGASQAHTGVVAGIMAISEQKRSRRILYLIISAMSIYGMLISGTRGAFAIVLVGCVVYLILVRNYKVILSMAMVLVTLFGLLKFTYIGQGNYEIRRLRTSLNPNDPSLQVRLENQRRLGQYLKSHYFGGGVGSAGYWGQRFSPGTFLANLALDSWYVRIAAEFGYVGLVFYMAMLLFILWKAWQRLRRETDMVAKTRLMALYCGLSGVLVASYANQVFGQLPTAILMYLSIVFLTQSDSANETDPRMA